MTATPAPDWADLRVFSDLTSCNPKRCNTATCFAKLLAYQSAVHRGLTPLWLLAVRQIGATASGAAVAHFECSECSLCLQALTAHMQLLPTGSTKPSSSQAEVPSLWMADPA